MASALDKLFAGADAPAAPARDLKVVASYSSDLAKDSKGNAGFVVRPVLADGTVGRFGDLWIRLAEGPAALRAFRSSLPAIAAAIDKLDAYMVQSGEWPAKPAKADAAAPAAAPAAPKAKPAAAKPAPAPAPAPAKAPTADIFDDLPF